MLARIAALLLTMGGLFHCAPAVASYPEKPIRIVVAFTPGSGNDRVARIVAEEMRKDLDVPILVENRPGAAGAIGIQSFLQAPPDGYTLIMTSSATHSANPWLIRNLPYDPIRDFAHITNLITTPLILVVPHGHSSTLEEFLKSSQSKARQNFGFGSSTSQVFASAFANMVGLDASPVAYKSQPQALTDLTSGVVHFMFADAAALDPFIKGNRLTALATTGHKRQSQLPSIPTLAELGYDNFDLSVWVGIAAHAETPAATVAKLSDTLVRIMSREDVVQRFAAVGMEAVAQGAAEQGKFVATQLEVWKRRIQDAGLAVQP